MREDATVSSIEDLERRIAALEEREDLGRRMAALEERLDVEAGLRAGGDRDLSDLAQTLRAQQHTIQALSITQSQHNDQLVRVETAVTVIRDQHGAALQQIIAMLDRLGGQDDPPGP
jgi:Tfp pilus assembly protein PilN